MSLDMLTFLRALGFLLQDDGAHLHLEHGLQDHGVALDNLAQGNELRVGAQEIQRSTPGRAACSWGRLHSI